MQFVLGDEDALTGKRETLSERSQRIIGKPLDVAEDSEKSPASQQGGGQQGGPKSRREQVIHAQRVHRLRTQQYIRELEKEVLRLRDNESNLRNQVHQLLKQVEVYQQLLTKDTSGKMSLQSAVPTQPMQPQSLVDSTINIDLQELEDVPSIGSCKVIPENIGPIQMAQTRSEDKSSHSSARQAPNPSPDTSSVFSTQHALDFVLALERPCLSHIKHYHVPFITDREPSVPPTEVDFNSGPAHLLNAGAYLLHSHFQQQSSSSASASTKDSTNNSKSFAFNANSAQIQQLFEASLTLPLTGEMTPVQIWKRLEIALRDHEKDRNSVESQKVLAEEINELRNEFAQYVYCNSFGAVLREEDVAKVLQKHGIEVEVQ